MIIATAGHIDHGKTTLVRALTGVDTDRLPEEKKRGISIDLGFAYWRTPGGATIGFVDVPGHERFIGNMLAGVCGIDAVLLIVAADDGIMPQTYEHLAIIDLLGVKRGVAVITKIDCVDSARVKAVHQDLHQLLAGTHLARIPVLPVSCVTRAGIPELRKALLAAVAAPRDGMRQCMLRYAIDRAFTVVGSGTVVTGTLFAGSVRTGDRSVLSPAGVDVRVRGIQKDGKPADEAVAGERCALNLAGIDVERAGRGNWLVAPAAQRPTRRLDVRLHVLPAERQPLRHWSAQRLYIGTAGINARVAVPHGGAITPGRSAFARLVLAQPVAAVGGERFILRDGASNRTLGGGVVLDPVPGPLRRDRAAHENRLAALELPSPRAAFEALLACTPGGLDLVDLTLAFNLPLERMRALAAQCDAVAIGRKRPIAFAADALARLEQGILLAVRAFHAREPQAEGIGVDALRRQCAPTIAGDPFMELLRTCAHRCQLIVSGTTVRQATHAPQQNASQQRQWSAVRPQLEKAGFHVPRVSDLAERTEIAEAELLPLLRARVLTGELMRVSEDRFYPRPTLAALAAIAATAAAESANGEFTVAQYRDRSGVGRNLAIEILECLDRLGVTRRAGLSRSMRKDPVAVLGAAAQVATRA